MASGCLCGRDKALTAAIQREMQNILGRVGEAAPGARNIHLLRARDGTVIYPTAGGAGARQQQDNALEMPSSPASTGPSPAPVLLALFRSGTQLGSALNVDGCTGVHARGSSTVVSSYMLGQYLLSFDSPTIGPDGTSIDSENVDRAVRPLLEDLELLLRDVAL